MSTNSPAHRWIVASLRAALVLALVGAGWLIYRRLPHADVPHGLGTSHQAHDTLLRIIIPRAVSKTGDSVISVQLYSIDVTAAQREFFDERRPGMRFEDFIVRRMGARQPIRTQLDAQGQTIVYVPPGRWWIHTTLEGDGQELSWRLPVNIAGRAQTVELTSANAYTRTKRF